MSKSQYTKEQQINQQLEKYNLKKKRNLNLLAYIVRHVSQKTEERVHICGDWLAFVTDVTMEKLKLLIANFCKWRFCPMCAWRKARKDALKIAVLMKYIQQEHQKEFLFLTLTAPNVTADKLKEEITRYNENFKLLMLRKDIKKVVKGYVRKLEITYNVERNDYHPHFHILTAVSKSYFTHSDQYIKRDKWLELWQDVMNDQTITQVDVRKVKFNNGKEVQEMAKYAAKDSDFLYSQEVFDVFYRALKGRQVVTYSGLFSEAHKLFKAKKLEYLKEQDNTEYMYWLLYRWGKGQYVQAEFRELSEHERKQINKKLIDEVDIEDD